MAQSPMVPTGDPKCQMQPGLVLHRPNLSNSIDAPGVWLAIDCPVFCFGIEHMASSVRWGFAQDCAALRWDLCLRTRRRFSRALAQNLITREEIGLALEGQYTRPAGCAAHDHLRTPSPSSLHASLHYRCTRLPAEGKVRVTCPLGTRGDITSFERIALRTCNNLSVQ